jgi:nucleotide-binding universal stress UspA family protein
MGRRINWSMKILIAYDGSNCAEAALDDLTRAGLPQESEAIVISVAEVWLPPPPSMYEIGVEGEQVEPAAQPKSVQTVESPALKEAQALALNAAERVRSNFPSWKVEAESTYGSPAWEVIKRADQWSPDLIVVGFEGKTALGRLLLGSVSQKILTEARSSVRVARGHVEVDASPVRLVIGLDGSPGADAAVSAVAARSWPEDSELRMVVVDDPLTPSLLGRIVPTVAAWVEEGNREERDWVQKIIESATGKLSQTGLALTSSVREGDPKKVLVEEAEKWRADSIFVGSTGFSNRLERFLLGSVSSAVAARAHCSVEVVRGQREAQSADEV